MSRLLFVVEDTFAIRGRGLVIVPGIVPKPGEVFRIGDPLLLKRPDGSALESAIGGIEMICTIPPRDDLVILLTELGKEDVPIGTEVWSVSHSQC